MPDPAPSASQSLRRALAVLGVWTLVAVLYAGQWYAYDATHGSPRAFLRELQPSLIEWYSWAALTPLVVAVARRFRFSRERPGVIGVHVVAGVAVSLLQGVIQTSAMRMWEPATVTFGAQLGHFLSKSYHINLLTYAAIVGAAHAFWLHEESRRRELAASRLETSLVDAQLRALKMQLQPHFLFNTLQAIATLIHDAPDAAEEMVLQLSELLRISFDDMDVQHVTLRRELEILKCYLGIEEMRFKDRLTVDFRIEDAALDLAVPAFILQPLAENAIRHGIARHAAADRVEIAARVVGDMLEMEVRNAAPESETRLNAPSRGLGLVNIRSRLEKLYGAAFALTVGARPGGGVAALIAIPARVMESGHED